MYNVVFRSMHLETPQLYFFAVLNSMIAGGSTNTMGGPQDLVVYNERGDENLIWIKHPLFVPNPE